MLDLVRRTTRLQTGETVRLLIVNVLIFPRDTGHRVKDHIVIRNEVIDEEATQEP